MKRLLFAIAVIAALAAPVSAQCDWRDFRGVELYVDMIGWAADVNHNPITLFEPPVPCDKIEFFCFRGNKLQWFHDGLSDFYLVELSRRDYTVLNVIDRHDDCDFFQIVQCKPGQIAILTRRTVVNFCHPKDHVDYRFTDPDRPRPDILHDDHSDRPRVDDRHNDHSDRPHLDDRHDDHADRPRIDDRHDDHADRPHVDDRHDDHADRPHVDDRRDDHADRPRNDNRSNRNSDNSSDDNDNSSHGRSGTHSSKSSTI